METKINQIKEYFKDLVFIEEGHCYTIKGKKLDRSVSNLISDHYEPFPVESASKNKSKKLGISQEEMIKQWDEKRDKACIDGSRVHLFGEKYMFDRTLQPKEKKEEAIVKFFNDLPDFIVPAIPEVTMYHKKLMFAGTADVLVYNTLTGKFLILDFKTNEDLFKNYAGKKMLGIFNNILDNPFNHYQIQLSLYQILLEQIPNIEVSGRKVIWLLPDGNYQLYDTEDFTKELKEYYKC